MGGDVKVELELSNYATIADWKNATDDVTSKFVSKLKIRNWEIRSYSGWFEKPRWCSKKGKKIVKKVCIINWLRKFMLFRLLYQRVILKSWL